MAKTLQTNRVQKYVHVCSVSTVYTEIGNQLLVEYKYSARGIAYTIVCPMSTANAKVLWHFDHGYGRINAYVDFYKFC